MMKSTGGKGAMGAHVLMMRLRSGEEQAGESHIPSASNRVRVPGRGSLGPPLA